MCATEVEVVVIGAGVIGLNTALLLAKDPNVKVSVVAKHMPGDYDPQYSSPWAGANVFPMSTNERWNNWERRTWYELKRLAEDVPAAGIHFQNVNIFRRAKDQGPSPFGGFFSIDPWYKELFPDFRPLSDSELPEGYASGCAFTSVCINIQVYLPWLQSQCLAAGVTFRRAAFSHVLDAVSMTASGEPASAIINCTGLSSRFLGGVQDLALQPGRGQTVVVRNDSGGTMCCSTGTDDGETEVMYVMTRAAGGGTVLGGTYDLGNWDSSIDWNIASRIMKRAVDACPALTGGRGVEALDIVRHGCGFRPYREGGARVEKEKIKSENGESWVVHNYGHAGWGYQGGWGCAEEVVQLVREIREEGGEKVEKVKLFDWEVAA